MVLCSASVLWWSKWSSVQHQFSGGPNGPLFSINSRVVQMVICSASILGWSKWSSVQPPFSGGPSGPLFSLHSRVVQMVLCSAVITSSPFSDRLLGLVVKAFASREDNSGLESVFQRDFSRSSHTSDLKNWHSARRHRVRNGTGRPGVSIL